MAAPPGLHWTGPPPDAPAAYRPTPHWPGTFRTTDPYSWPVHAPQRPAYGAPVKRVIVLLGLAAPTLVLGLLVLNVGGLLSAVDNPLPVPLGLVMVVAIGGWGWKETLGTKANSVRSSDHSRKANMRPMMRTVTPATR